MLAYKIEFKPSVEKDLRKIPGALASRILERIEKLAQTPLSPAVVKLKNTDCFYRVRVSDYRIVYEVNHAASTVLIHYVRNRKEIYRLL